MASGLEILNLHAQGGMAEVYRARATDDNGHTWYYAVKRILPELLEDPEMLRMFVAEQQVAACLLHKNIVRVYDVTQADTAETYIVMEFLEGHDLREVIDAAANARRTLPVWFCIHVARELCQALHYATTEAKDKHGRILGLIHRDISPHNIFLCTDGSVKLTDFGVARVQTAEVRTRVGVIKGKFGYMSPEQLSADELDHRSDLYNVGILLYESLSGAPLFSADTVTQFIAAMVKGEIALLDPALEVPQELESLMRRALSKKREDRPPNAQALRAELASIATAYRLSATSAHIADELRSLFPQPLSSAKPAAPVSEIVRTSAKTPMGVASIAPVAEPDIGDDAIFTTKRPAPPPPAASELAPTVLEVSPFGPGADPPDIDPDGPTEWVHAPAHSASVPQAHIADKDPDGPTERLAPPNRRALLADPTETAVPDVDGPTERLGPLSGARLVGMSRLAQQRRDEPKPK